jgi:hypothetical protein
VAAVCAAPLDPKVRQEIVEALRHDSLPCPARGLELVVYTERIVRAGTTEPGFELNLDTGAGMPFRVDAEPGDERHWFAIDRSILAVHGRTLVGPPARELFAPIPRDRLLLLVADSVAWHRAARTADSTAVLNACRALRFAADDVWSSKPSAGAWALARDEHRRLVASALVSGASAESLPSSDVERFLEHVELVVRKTARAAR